VLHEFIPAADAVFVAEAIKRVFDKHGDRKNKNRARLRFLILRLEFDAFRKLYERELDALRASDERELKIRPMPNLALDVKLGSIATQTEVAPEYGEWFRANVVPQRQAGFYFATIPMALGDI